MSFAGPWRRDEQSANGDLSTIRAAAASKTERSAAIQAMEDEAHRLKDEAKTGHGGVRPSIQDPFWKQAGPKWQHIGLVWDWFALAWAGRTPYQLRR